MTVTKGHFALEFVLWLCFLVPGIIYSIWRLTTRRETCPDLQQRKSVTRVGADGTAVPSRKHVGEALIRAKTQRAHYPMRRSLQAVRWADS